MQVQMSVEAAMPLSSGAPELRIEPSSPVLSRPGATGEGYRSALAEVGTMHSRALHPTIDPTWVTHARCHHLHR